jgi:hypothetical protein
MDDFDHIYVIGNMDEIWYEWEGSSMWSGHNDENNEMENHMICMK